MTRKTAVWPHPNYLSSNEADKGGMPLDSFHTLGSRNNIFYD